MHNIVREKQNGTLAVTGLAPETIEAQEKARSYESVVARRSAITAEMGERRAAIESLERELRAAPEKTKAALGRKLDGERALLAAIELDASKVAFYDAVKASLGLNSHEHEELLLKQGNIPAGYVCRGHNIEVDDKGFFDALCWKDGRPGHDMERCRDIWKNKMREARAPKLAALDVEFVRALEAGDTQRQQQIVATKQALRDVTTDPAIDAAATPEELKAVWPAVLAGV